MSENNLILEESTILKNIVNAKEEYAKALNINTRNNDNGKLKIEKLCNLAFEYARVAFHLSEQVKQYIETHNIKSTYLKNLEQITTEAYEFAETELNSFKLPQNNITTQTTQHSMNIKPFKRFSKQINTSKSYETKRIESEKYANYYMTLTNKNALKYNIFYLNLSLAYWYATICFTYLQSIIEYKTKNHLYGGSLPRFKSFRKRTMKNLNKNTNTIKHRYNNRKRTQTRN